MPPHSERSYDISWKHNMQPYSRAKPKGSICFLYKLADAAF